MKRKPKGPFTYLPYKRTLKLRTHNHSQLGYDKLEINYLVVDSTADVIGVLAFNGFDVESYTWKNEDTYMDILENYIDQDMTDDKSEKDCFWCSDTFKKAMAKKPRKGKK
jgi:hypothetical protein